MSSVVNVSRNPYHPENTHRYSDIHLLMGIDYALHPEQVFEMSLPCKQVQLLTSAREENVRLQRLVQQLKGPRLKVA